jgi:hypothetical protein
MRLRQAGRTSDGKQAFGRQAALSAARKPIGRVREDRLQIRQTELRRAAVPLFQVQELAARARTVRCV